MQIDWPVVINIVVPIIVVLLGILLDRYYRERPILIVYIGHISNFTVRGEEDIPIYTHKYCFKKCRTKICKQRANWA